MANTLQIVSNDLPPEDQERENRIVELRLIFEDTYGRPLHERRTAWTQMQELIAQRPEYVVKKMEAEQGLT